LKAFAQARCSLSGVLVTAVREHDKKLFASIPANRIRRSKDELQPLSDGVKNHISDRVSVGIVYGFEVIDVGQDDRTFGTIAITSTELILKAPDDSAMIQKAG
jgi:hypothetical protein